MTTILVTSDLHLTNRRQDSYRWEFLSWITDRAKQTGAMLFILGDLTDRKDRHPAELVNRVIAIVRSLPSNRLVILKGNHDYIDPDCPFFGFLSSCITKPTKLEIDRWLMQFIPHGYDLDPDPEADLVFCHHTVAGARSATGHALEGPSPSARKRNRRIISGDVHAPQRIGDVTYVGAPYPIDFGDDYSPRALKIALDDDIRITSIPVRTIRKHRLVINGVSGFEEADLREGDQVKVILDLPRSEFGSWEEYRRAIREIASERRVVLSSIMLQEKKTTRVRITKKCAHHEAADLLDLLTKYCVEKGIPDHVRDAGLEIIDSVQGG